MKEEMGEMGSVGVWRKVMRGDEVKVEKGVR